jgi:hypothetical protein
MLGGTEPLAADSRSIDHAFVESFVREYPLAAQRRPEMPEALVAELTVDEADILAEVAGRACDEIARRRRRVDETSLGLADQSE